MAPVLGSLALASLISAAPLEKRGTISYGNQGSHVTGYQDSQSTTSVASYGGSESGYYTASASASGYATASSYAPQYTGSSAHASADSGSNPFSFPLSNGFPDIKDGSSELDDIENQAHGTLPNAPPAPPSMPPAEDDLKSLRFIAFNELWEVAFFTELLYNLTNNVEGFQFHDGVERQAVIDAITAVQAQEELHTLNANNALANFNAGPIQPCQYVAPVSDFQGAISLAATFTDVVLGTLGDVQTHFGLNGDAGLIRGVAAVIGQEGEQDGFYRSLLHELPSQAPFLTASTREFAFSALNQMFVVPGSCPNINTIDLPIFGKLNLLTQGPIQPVDQSLQFSFSASGDWSKYSNKWQDLSLVYINQQNVPVVEPITQASVSHDGTTTFSANFPFVENKMFGLTIATVVDGQGPFANVSQVADATLFGPALIEIM